MQIPMLKFRGLKRGSLWKSPAFVRLWSAAAISAAGDQVTRLALPIIAVATLGAGPFEVGLLLTFGQLPQLLFTLVAGAWIDRMPKRPVIIISDAGRAAVLLAVPLAAWLDLLTMPWLFAVGFVTGVFTTWHMIAWQSLIPLIAPGDQILPATSSVAQIEAISEVAGPVAGGGLVQILGAPTAVLLDAVSFAGSAALVARIAVDEQPADAVRNPLLSEIKAGFRYMFNEPTLRAIALSGGVGVLFFSIREPLLRVFALDTKQLSPGEYGLIFSIAAVGYAIGSFLPGPLARRFGIGHAIVWPHLGLGAWGLLIALAVTLDWHAIPVIALMLFLEGLMEPANNINQLSLRLALMPPAMRGRLTSVARFMIRGAYPLGTLAGGVMGEVIGIKGALWISALAGPLGAACYLGSPVLRYRRLPEFQTD